MRSLNPAQGVSRDAHISAHIAHQLASPDDVLELIDEIMSENHITKDLLTCALAAITIEAPRTVHYDMAMDTIDAVLRKQAQRRAEADWNRLMQQEGGRA